MPTTTIQLAPALNVLLIAGFVSCGFMGLLALASPRLFQRLAKGSSQWVDSAKLLAVLDRRVDIDGYVLRYTRLFGLVVIASLTAAWWLFIWRA